jgi:hypothetical protein
VTDSADCRTDSAGSGPDFAECGTGSADAGSEIEAFEVCSFALL